MKVILASQSKRRQELLKQLGIDFLTIVSLEDEIFNPSLTPLENCINVSYEKAKNVKENTEGDRIIISCDTIVLFKNKIYGKPKNREDAYLMLKELSGNTHEALSCLTVICIKNNQETTYKDYGSCLVSIDNMTDKEIYDWIDLNKPYDKAGGYAIQEEFSKHITKVEGDFYSIVGLPVNKLYNILKKIYLQP